MSVSESAITCRKQVNWLVWCASESKPILLCLQLVLSILPPVPHSVIVWACFAVPRANKPAVEQVRQPARQEGNHVPSLPPAGAPNTPAHTTRLLNISFTSVMEQILLKLEVGSYFIWPYCNFSPRFSICGCIYFHCIHILFNDNHKFSHSGWLWTNYLKCVGGKIILLEGITIHVCILLL